MYAVHITVMIIGFTERTQTVSEYQVPGVDLFELLIPVATSTTAEKEHPMIFSIVESITTAVVEPLTSQADPEFDALFGSRDNSDGRLTVRYILRSEIDTIPPLVTFIASDFRPEAEECFTIRISPVDITGRRELFTCNEDNIGAESYFCEHTVCIESGEGKYCYLSVWD